AAGRGAARRHAGTRRRAVQVHGARPAEPDATAVLRPRQPQLVAEVPEERHLGITVELSDETVDHQLDHASAAAAQAVLFGGVALLEAAVEVATVEARVLASHQVERALPPALLRSLVVEERDFRQRREAAKESHDPR